MLNIYKMPNTNSIVSYQNEILLFQRKPNKLSVGDVRIFYKVICATEASVIAQFNSDQLLPYYMDQGMKHLEMKKCED